MATFLIDTCIFIDFLKERQPAMEFFKRLRDERANVLFSAMTETELLAGKENESEMRRNETLQILGEYQKVLIDNPIARMAGDMRRSIGLQVPDAIIAAAAVCSGAHLITCNIQDFCMVPGLVVLKPY